MKNKTTKSRHCLFGLMALFVSLFAFPSLSFAQALEVRGSGFKILDLKQNEYPFSNRTNIRFMDEIPAQYAGWQFTQLNANNSANTMLEVRAAEDGYLYVMVEDKEKPDVCSEWATAGGWERLPDDDGKIQYGTANPYQTMFFYRRPITAGEWVTVEQPAVFSGASVLASELKVYVDPSYAVFADGNYYLKNVEAGRYLAGGNSWGTQASLNEHGEYITLARQQNGTYTIESRVSNGGTKYYLSSGAFMDSDAPVHLAFVASGEYYTIANGTNYLGYDGTSTVLKMDIADAAAPAALWQVIPEADMKASLAAATVDAPVDATFLVKDHNFGRNNRDQGSWNIEASNKNLSGGNNINNCAESYHSTFTLSQALTEVPNGVYALTAQGFYRQDGSDNENLPYFYANDAKSTFPLLTGPENSMSTASESFSAGNYTINPIFVKVTDGTLTIGAKLEVNTALWCIWDHFVLTYYGADADINTLKFAAYVDKIKELKAEAATFEGNENVVAAIQTQIAEAIAAADAELANTSATEETLQAAIDALNGVIKAAKLSVSNKDAIDAMYNVLNSTDVYTPEAYDTFKAAADAYLAAWEAGTLTETVVNPTSVQGWRSANAYDDYLLSAWTIGGAQCKDFDTALYINTWSTEGGNDGSNFIVPFFEYWTGDGESLGANTLQAVKTGLAPRSIYKVTAWTRVRIKNGASGPMGITFNAGGTSVDACAGAQIGTSQFYLAEITAIGVTDVNGTLKINYEIAADNNISWLSFKNVKCEEYSVYAPSNLDFALGTPAVVGICTYAKDIAANGTTLSQMQEVPGWTIVENGDARAAGIFTYGSGVWNGGTGYNVPATNPNGETIGNALGVVAVWGGKAQYTQKITLPAGDYTITIPVYNAKGGTTAPVKSLIGFIADNGTEYLAPAKSYAVDTWTTETITFSLAEETTGVLSLGYQAPNSGSSANQHLFFDCVSITPNNNAFYLAPTILKAEAIDQTILSEDVATALNDAITAAKAVDTTDDAAVAAAISALQAAIQAAYDAEDAIIALNAAKDAARAELAMYKEYSENSIPNGGDFKTAYDQAIAEAEAAVEAAETIAAVEAAVEPLEAARQTYVQNAYPTNGFAFDMTFLVKNADFSAAAEGWTTEGTVGKKTGQHWSGVGANQYIEPCDWNATGWTSSFNQVVVVPVGKYTVQAAGRASANVTLNLVVGDQTVAYPSNGDNGGTIATDGTEWESVEAGIAAGKSFAKNNVGQGWTYAAIETVVTDPEKGITIGATATTANAHEWASVDDFKLLLTESLPENVEGIPENGSTVATDLTKVSFMFNDAQYAKVNADNADPIVLVDAEGNVTELTAAQLANFNGMVNAYDLTSGDAPIFPGEGVYTVKIPAGKFLLGADEASATTASKAIELTYTVVKKELIATPASGETVETLESLKLTFQGYSNMYIDNDVVWDREAYAVVIKKGDEVVKEYTPSWGDYDSPEPNVIVLENIGLTEAGTYTLEFPEGKFNDFTNDYPAFTLTYTVLGLENVTVDPKDGNTVATDLEKVLVVFNDAAYAKVNEENTAAVTLTDAEGNSVELAGAKFVHLGENGYNLVNEVEGAAAPIFAAEGTYTVYVPAGKFLLGADEANATTASKAFKFTYTVVEKKVIANPESESAHAELNSIELTFQGYNTVYMDDELVGMVVEEAKPITIKKDNEVVKTITSASFTHDVQDVVVLNELGLTEVGTYTIEFPEGKFLAADMVTAIPAFTLTYIVEGYQDVTADPANGSTVDTNLKSFAVTFNGVTAVAQNEETMYDPIIIYDENGEYAGALRNAVFEIAGNVVTVKNQQWGEDAPIFQTAGTYTLEFPKGKFLVDDAASKVFKLTYVVEQAEVIVNVITDPANGSTVETLEKVRLTYEGYQVAEPDWNTSATNIVITKDGETYAEFTGLEDGIFTAESDYGWNEWDLNLNLTEAGAYTITIPAAKMWDPMTMSRFPELVLNYTVTGAPATGTKTEMVVEVERVEGLGYAADVVAVDLAKVCETLGITSINEATVWGVNASTMEWVTNPMASACDGWMNNNGDYASWGEGYVCYKYMADGNFQLCTHPDNEPTVGTVFNAYYGFTAGTDSVLVKTVITFVEAPAIEVETVKTITINHEEMEKAAYSENTATFDVAEVCEALDVESLAGVETFIVNATTGEFVMNTTDGWRDANGDAAGWGSGEGMVCVKLSDPASGTFDYIGCIDETHKMGEVYTAKWAIVANGKAVILDVVITFVINPVGINGISAEDIVKTEYFGMNGAALNAPVKGINIVKYTLVDGKVVTSKVYVK